ncbi:hypothetical protein KIN20_008722 [Parelaphostrongylus tenuis]|uniref:Uncharacterized protein n=1 Tax=Parelaphostrongylus tenuis TaxID=148309 RepID=A0AAD5MQT6_PARTN|nr:hypothetical protein KIN20_008722 [Parelaphostrongylus tenuis]
MHRVAIPLPCLEYGLTRSAVSAVGNAAVFGRSDEFKAGKGDLTHKQRAVSQHASHQRQRRLNCIQNSLPVVNLF